MDRVSISNVFGPYTLSPWQQLHLSQWSIYYTNRFFTSEASTDHLFLVLVFQISVYSYEYLSFCHISSHESFGYGNLQSESTISDQTSKTFKKRNFRHNIIDHNHLLTQGRQQINKTRNLNEALSHINPQTKGLVDHEYVFLSMCTSQIIPVIHLNYKLFMVFWEKLDALCQKKFFRNALQQILTLVQYKTYSNGKTKFKNYTMMYI